MLVNQQGETALPGVPLMVIPGPEEGWYRVHDSAESATSTTVPWRAASQGWISSRGEVGPRFLSVDDPFFLSGHAIHRARGAQGETWVLDGVPLGLHPALTSRPSVSAEGLWYWARDDNDVHALIFHPNE
jgi:hypothetical protein